MTRASSSSITHLFFDIGGVLGTNGWDREQRSAAALHFSLDEEFERRHGELVGEWESGRITLADYLESTIFYCPRPFTPADFTGFMFAQSRPFPDSVELVRQLSAGGGPRLLTINNESAELNLHRIESFGLRDLFVAFLSSCWLGVRKPSRLIFERALGIAQADPARSLFVDDREQNLVPARALGLQTLLFTDATNLARSFTALGLL